MAYAPRGGYRGNRNQGNRGHRGQAGRGRGGMGRGGGNSGMVVDEETLFKGLVRTPVKTWTVKSVAGLVAESVNRPYLIIDRKRVASYNWVDTSKEPKVVVPGAPKEFYEWTGGDLSGSYNEEREISENRTFDAVFTAVRIMEPSFKLNDYDIVTDMESLKGLFHICLQTVNTMRAAHVPVGLAKSDKDECQLRIDVQLVGTTLLLRRQEQELEPASGVGLEYRRVCSKAAPISMMRGEKLDDGNLSGKFKLISGMAMGSVRFLLVDEIDAARYPEESGQGQEYTVPADAGVKVEIGGFKGNLEELQLIGFASRSFKFSSLVPQKWMTQYIAGVPYRFLGIHNRGIFTNPPSLKSLDDTRQICSLTPESSELWLKVLERILDEIVFFARQHDFEGQSGDPQFAIIVTPSRDPDRANVAIYQADSEATADEKAAMISEKTLEYLMKTVK